MTALAHASGETDPDTTVDTFIDEGLINWNGHAARVVYREDIDACEILVDLGPPPESISPDWPARLLAHNFDGQATGDARTQYSLHSELGRIVGFVQVSLAAADDAPEDLNLLAEIIDDTAFELDLLLVGADTRADDPVSMQAATGLLA